MKNLFFSRSSVYIGKYSSAIFVCLSFMTGTVQAGTIKFSYPNSAEPIVSDDGKAIIVKNPIEPIGSDLFDDKKKELLRFKYPTWTVKTGNESSGIFDVTKYNVYSAGATSLGTQLEMTYSNVTNVPEGKQLQYIQFVNTNEPNVSSPFIDTENKDNPFYLTDLQASS